MNAGPGRIIEVLLVEADEGRRRHLAELIASDAALRIAFATGDAGAALDYLASNRPDVVLMDNELPHATGFEVTRRIMETRPLPIVLCAAPADDLVFRSLEAGAVACVEKPALPGAGGAQGADTAATLVRTLKLMAEVKVVRRWTPAERSGARPARTRADDSVRAVGIGASTGGPVVLQTILAGLPPDFGAPVLVVQHIARGFLAGMCEWLRQTSGLKVQIGAHGMLPEPGHVYLAPDDFQMGIAPGGRIVLDKEPAGRLRPSVAYLFDNLARVHGRRAIGVLLTGMGQDGAAELRRMRDAGAQTIVQDKHTSVVHGMPGAAIALGAACHVLPAEGIAARLVELVEQRRPGARAAGGLS